MARLRHPRIAALALLVTAGLAACGPIPVAEAERACLADARGATGPHGHVSMGIATDGHSVRPVTGLAVSISSDALAGRDPSDVFNRCVLRRSGQMPSRPLADQPGWSR